MDFLIDDIIIQILTHLSDVDVDNFSHVNKRSNKLTNKMWMMKIKFEYPEAYDFVGSCYPKPRLASEPLGSGLEHASHAKPKKFYKVLNHSLLKLDSSIKKHEKSEKYVDMVAIKYAASNYAAANNCLEVLKFLIHSNFNYPDQKCMDDIYIKYGSNNQVIKYIQDEIDKLDVMIGNKNDEYIRDAEENKYSKNKRSALSYACWLFLEIEDLTESSRRLLFLQDFQAGGAC